jgi:hypothetical protein
MGEVLRDCAGEGQCDADARAAMSIGRVLSNYRRQSDGRELIPENAEFLTYKQCCPRCSSDHAYSLQGSKDLLCANCDYVLWVDESQVKAPDNYTRHLRDAYKKILELEGKPPSQRKLHDNTGISRDAIRKRWAEITE